MRTGEAFQAFRKVGTIVLDKTGTLTEGRPALREILVVRGTDRGALLALAAAAEASSEHPLARALVDAAIDRGIPFPPSEDFESVTGQGVVASVNGTAVLIGHRSLLRANGIDVAPLPEAIDALEKAGRTVAGVAADGVLLGALALGE